MIWSFVAIPELKSVLQAGKQLVKACESRKPFPIIFIHGPTGCGKTTVLHEFSRLLNEHDSVESIILSTKEVAEAATVSDQTSNPVMSSLKSSPFVGIEDIPFLPGSYVNLISSILDSRSRQRKYTVITSNVPPSELKLPSRLTGRFLGGLVLELKNPGPKSRRILAEHFCTELKLTVSAGVLDTVPKHTKTVRSVLGEVNRIATILREKPKADEQELIELLTDSDRNTSHDLLFRITQWIGEKYGVTNKKLLGSSRQANIVIARQSAMYLAREMGLTYKQIGEWFGGRDHSTVMHACDKIVREIAENEVSRQFYRDMLDKFI